MLRTKIDQEKFEPEEVRRCAELLAAGGVGIIPTDTVYGIAALATNVGAVSRVLRIKRRQPGKPLPVQVASSWDANLLGVTDSPAATALIGQFWPGALTIVVERRPGTDLAFQDGSTIGLRVPASCFCLALISEAGFLVLPSANAPGGRPPGSPNELTEDVLESVDFLIDAGPCPGGIESTVVDVTAGVRVVREGAILRAEILAAVGGAG
ncbi:MAG: L-threonylcarbamoyladenylate synthase [Candidatus Geothermincolia bacterium]